MKWLTLLIPMLLGALLEGCMSRPPAADAPRQLVLRQAISIPEGQARAFLQEGTVVSKVDEFTPHCALEIRQVNGPPRSVPAGTYAITRVQDVNTPMVLTVPGQQFAGVGFGVNIGIGFGSGSVGIGGWGDSYSDVFEGYHFWLADSARVGLMRLTCLGARAQPSDVRPPTRAEMAAALGNLGQLLAAP